MKWAWFLICCVASATLLAVGLLIPAHLRAVDAGVVQSAGKDGSTLPGQIKMLAGKQDLGAAQILAEAGLAAKVPQSDELGTEVAGWARQNPDAYFWGDAPGIENLFGGHFDPATVNSQTVTAFLVLQKNREAALARLHDSVSPAVQELLRTRSLNDTVLLPSASSAAGQVYDTAVSVCGLLLDSGSISDNLKGSISLLAAAANHGDSPEPMEQVLMDLMSLGQRLNWDQLTALVSHIQTPETLHQLTDIVRNDARGQLPVLFAVVQLSGQPEAVAKYLDTYKETGFPDLTASLRYGTGGVDELLKEQRRFYSPGWERHVTAFDPVGSIFYSAAYFSRQQPVFAVAVKWLCYLLAGFFLGAAFHHARPAVSPLQRPLQVRGAHFFFEFLFSVGFLLVVLVLSEPFLAQDSQKGTFTLRPHLPMAGGVAPAGIVGIGLNHMIILTMLIFFVLQALLYLACLVKLGEIRRQNVPSRTKLKLLENEDHLFDAGLYLGFVGTILSLIIASLHLVAFSLMAAYSSTSFGIIFVVIFKIFHLRPARRQLLMEVETENVAATTSVTASAAPLRTVAPAPVLPS